MPIAPIFAATPLLRSIPDSVEISSVRKGEQIGYDELAARVAGIADSLKHADCAPGDRVVISVADPIACLCAIFAVWSQGLCAVLINPRLPEDERNRVSRKVSPSVWLDDRGVRAMSAETPRATNSSGAVLILMTSGTTGDPKGIMHGFDGLEARLKLNVAAIGPEALAQTLCPLPLFFGHGMIGNCLSPIYAGQHVHLWPTPVPLEYASFADILDDRGITFLSSVPTMWRMILQMSQKPAKALKRVHVGSAPLPSDLWRQISDWCRTDQVFNMYGMTETANWISGAGLKDALNPEGMVGAPWGGTFRVLRDGALHTEGRGEIAVETPSMMLGFWGGTPSQAEAMMDGYLKTGDIGILSPDQSVKLLGRNKHEINRGGIKVLAEEVDMLLERHPDVREACSFALPDKIAGEVVGAVVTTKSDVNLTPDAIITWCRSQARPDAVPFRLEIIDEIPKNDRGKISRADVQKAMSDKWSVA